MRDGEIREKIHKDRGGGAGEGKHSIGVHSSSFIVDSKNKAQDLKLILVSKEEREKLEEEICKKIEKPETAVAYILSKDGEFYVP